MGFCTDMCIAACWWNVYRWPQSKFCLRKRVLNLASPDVKTGNGVISV